MPELFESLGRAAGLAGISCGVLLLIFRAVIRKNVFPQMTKDQAYKTLNLIIVATFLIAVIGIGAWTYNARQREAKTGKDESAKEAPAHPTTTYANALEELNDSFVPIFFDRKGSLELTNDDKATLRNYAAKLKVANAAHVLIIGNVDEINPHSNRWASMVAAENVRDFLVDEGLTPSIFEVRPVGALNPIKPKGSAYNNRVEIKVTHLQATAP